mgnify:CR=1 FL=1
MVSVTVRITDGTNTWIASSDEVWDICSLLAVYRDATVAAGFPIGELAADNDLGDVFWSDEAP